MTEKIIGTWGSDGLGGYEAVFKFPSNTKITNIEVSNDKVRTIYLERKRTPDAWLEMTNTFKCPIDTTGYYEVSLRMSSDTKLDSDLGEYSYVQ